MPAFQYLGAAHGRNLMESALAEPQQTFFGRYLYPTVFDKGAALFRSLTNNHCLQDGNKRTALTATFVFLAANGYLLYCGEAVAYTLKIASSQPELPWKDVSRWLRRNSISMQRLLRISQAESALRLGLGVWSDQRPEELVGIADVLAGLRSKESR
ncbi:MAG: type II toxin-antitoxin system death-on-curing family toxin [Chloroflexi bacterium]|nr:type II toxin-antitoxin system death-on-curing family toxin [Chloroflexota bacterium]